MNKKLCLFCGSQSGNKPVYEKVSEELGSYLARISVGLVYGGASIGLMGRAAQACLDQGGEVIGVIPKKIVDLEVGKQDITKLHLVDNMHHRKQLMYDLSDAFLALPGGFGTLDELCEILTWKQLSYHSKPIGLLNINGYFDHLIKHFDFMVSEGFLSQQHRELVIVKDRCGPLVERLLA